MAFLDHTLLPTLFPGMACSATYVRPEQNKLFALYLTCAILKWKTQTTENFLELLVMVGDDCKPRDLQHLL